MILVITDRRHLGKQLAADLCAQGIFTFECPPETGAFYCETKDTGGVILDCIPDLMAAEALCQALRSSYPQLPIFAIVPKESVPNLEADRLSRTTDPQKLFQEILDFCTTACAWSPKPLSSYFLTVGNTPEEIIYMGYPMPLSHRAHRILQCLFYRYPKITSADDLMSLCYPDGKEQIGNLAVQIHHINQAAAKIDARPLVVNVYKQGYKLRDGIL
jgi:DNA-binding response OmpR family regulator